MANGFFTDRAVATSPFRIGSSTGASSVAGLIPIAYGQVRVCTSADIGTTTTPCPHPATVFDAFNNSLNIPAGGFGQVTADVVGRFSFQAVPGNYQIQVAPTGSNTPEVNYPITVTNFSLGVTPSLSGNNVWTGTNLFNGGLSATNFESILYADQFTSTAVVTSPSTAPIVNVLTTGGTVAANQYACKITYQGASGGETTASGTSNIFTTTGATSQLECTDINYPPPAGAKCYNVYWQTGGAGNFFLGHSCIALNAGDIQTTTPATSGTQPPVSNTATSILSNVQATAGSPGTYVLPSTLSSTLGSQGAPSAGQTIVDYRDGTLFMQPVSGASIGLSISMPNASTANTQLQAGIIGSLGNVNISTEWNRVQSFYPYAGVLGIVLNPNPSTIQGAAGVMGIAATTSPDTTGGGAVGGYFQGNCLANQSKCWGINPVVFTAPGINSDFWNICELDINSHDTSATTANGLIITGASSAMPAAATAIGIPAPDSGTGGACGFGACAKWGTGLALGKGAANVGISLGQVANGNSQPSQGINFVNTDSGGVVRTSGISVDASGNILLQSFANVITANGMLVNSFLNITGNTQFAGHLNQSATGKFGGTCTMAAATTCTFSITSGFTSTPICITSVQSAAPTTFQGSCALSGTTVTVTASAANSNIWGVVLVGNPS